MQIEMQVQEEFNLAPVVWNYEEVKREIAERVAPYKSAVVTPDAIPGAKADLALLRRVSKAINDRKIAIKREFSKPYLVFESQVREVLEIIDEGVSNIDQQLKTFDEAKRLEKRKEIRNFYEMIAGELTDKVPMERLWNPRWENVGYKMADIQAEISKAINRLRDDMETIKGMKSRYEAELLCTLYKTLDIAEVVRHNQALEAISSEQTTRGEEISAGEDKNAPEGINAATAHEFDTPEPLETVYIRIWCTRDQKAAFRKFLMENGIKYGAVK